MNTEEINQLNKELHDLLGLEWHEWHPQDCRIFQCSCGKIFTCRSAWVKHTDDIKNHDFTSDAGRIELLRIIEGKEWYVDFLYRDDFSTAANAFKVLARRLDVMEGVLDINVSILTEQSGEHKLCCAVRDFLKGEK